MPGCTVGALGRDDWINYDTRTQLLRKDRQHQVSREASHTTVSTLRSIPAPKRLHVQDSRNRREGALANSSYHTSPGAQGDSNSNRREGAPIQSSYHHTSPRVRATDYRRQGPPINNYYPQTSQRRAKHNRKEGAVALKSKNHPPQVGAVSKLELAKMPLLRQVQSERAARKAKEEEATRMLAEAHAALEAIEKPKIMLIDDTPPPPDEHDSTDLMKWIYSIPYSRRLSFLPRDFSDGVLIAEIVKYYIPELVDLHNYSPANGRTNKIRNWELLNQKVFTQLGFRLRLHLIEQLVAPRRLHPDDKTVRCYPIEQLLFQIRKKLAEINPKVYDYRKNKLPLIDPFEKRNTVRIPGRPMSRQPMSEAMWRIEKEAGEKYGEYTGNPIIWDGVQGRETDLEFASIGIAKQRFLKIKEQFKQEKLQELTKEPQSCEATITGFPNITDIGSLQENFSSASRSISQIEPNWCGQMDYGNSNSAYGCQSWQD